jgi:hypothetical protein
VGAGEPGHHHRRWVELDNATQKQVYGAWKEAEPFLLVAELDALCLTAPPRPLPTRST